MKIYSMGTGIFDEAVEELKDKACVVLVAETRDELGAALRNISFSDDVTVVPVYPPAPGSPSGGHE